VFGILLAPLSEHYVFVVRLARVLAGGRRHLSTTLYPLPIWFGVDICLPGLFGAFHERRALTFVLRYRLDVNMELAFSCRRTCTCYAATWRLVISPNHLRRGKSLALLHPLSFVGVCCGGLVSAFWRIAAPCERAERCIPLSLLDACGRIRCRCSLVRRCLFVACWRAVSTWWYFRFVVNVSRWRLVAFQALMGVYAWLVLVRLLFLACALWFWCVPLLPASFIYLISFGARLRPFAAFC